MLSLAHFTLTELPGTISIWLAGIALGAALMTRETRRLSVPLALIAAIFVTSMLGERYDWSAQVQIGLDLAFVALTGLCAVQLLRRLPAGSKP